MPNPYKEFPLLQTDALTLRPVRADDASDLLCVYGDAQAVPFFNGDNCHGDTFHYATLERMNQAIAFWQWSYDQGYFVRWCVQDNVSGKAIGTVELFDRPAGDREPACAVLRVDLRSDMETAPVMTGVLEALFPAALAYFTSRTVITKCWSYAHERREALERLGFTPSPWPLIGDDGTVYSDYYVRTF